MDSDQDNRMENLRKIQLLNRLDPEDIYEVVI